jgi:hypothetical protein
MSTAKHETNCPSVDHDVEKRIKNFGYLTIVALCNITVLIFLVGPLWMLVTASPSIIPMPFNLHCVCIGFVYLAIIAKNEMVLRILIGMREIFLSEIEDEKHSRNRDLATRITKLEDWILAYFCVIVVLSTIGFVGWYWITIITLTFRAFFYWACTMGGLCLLFWMLKRTIRFYRKVKGINYEEAWGMLVGLSIVRFYDKFEGLKAKGVLGQLLDIGRLPFEILKFLLDTAGFHIGRGPLFGESIV